MNVGCSPDQTLSSQTAANIGCKDVDSAYPVDAADCKSKTGGKLTISNDESASTSVIPGDAEKNVVSVATKSEHFEEKGAADDPPRMEIDGKDKDEEGANLKVLVTNAFLLSAEEEDLTKPSGATFPQHLMSLLDSGLGRTALFWMPDGVSFCLLPKNCGTTFMDLHFSGNKFESLTRKLNRWGFKRLANQAAPGESLVFKHPLFQRGRPELLKGMSGGSGKWFAKRKESQEEPNTSSTVKNEEAEQQVHSTKSMILDTSPQQLAANLVTSTMSKGDQEVRQETSKKSQEKLLSSVVRSRQALDALQAIAAAQQSSNNQPATAFQPARPPANQAGGHGTFVVNALHNVSFQTLAADALSRNREQEIGLIQHLQRMRDVRSGIDAALPLSGYVAPDVVLQQDSSLMRRILLGSSNAGRAAAAAAPQVEVARLLHPQFNATTSLLFDNNFPSNFQAAGVHASTNNSAWLTELLAERFGRDNLSQFCAGGLAGQQGESIRGANPRSSVSPQIREALLQLALSQHRLAARSREEDQRRRALYALLNSMYQRAPSSD